MLVAIVATFALVGVGSYVLIAAELKDRLVASYAEAQRADIKSLEAVAARSGDDAETIREIDEVLDAVGERPGTRETLLIDRGRIVRASADDDAVGTRDTDERIDAAIDDGRSYAGHEADPGMGTDNFEFVAPLDLPQGRFAYEISYSNAYFDSQLSDIRRTLLIIVVLGTLLSTLIFYLLGGRTLLRSHRIALQRATHDGLTDLPNHRAFQQELVAAVASAERYDTPLALVVLDLDGFKQVNDRQGHPAGDAVLVRVAGVLRELRAADRAFRVGGDEFALVLRHTDGQGARTVARRLCRALLEVDAPASIGMSEWRHGEPADALRAEADAALYEAKRRGGTVVADFDDIRERVEVTTEAKKATVRRLIDDEALEIVLQPIWDLASRELLGIEALMRPDPSFDLSGPSEAFDIAEQIGRVHDLDAVCARKALERAAQLPDGVSLFLNISPRSLDFSPDEATWIADAVLDAGTTPARVVLEVTERFPRRTEAVIATLEQLRAQGFRLALDDVGTGNSGLEVLSRVDAEFVKIDRGIVAAAAEEPNARAVLLAIATFARQTGAYVIAEGIEDDETLTFLRGIDHRALGSEAIIQGGQGFRLGRPSPELPAGALRATVS
jgi:diguanylate cyclase (GGDEF)-like protein